VERRVLGGAGCSAQQSKARRAELGFCGGCGGEDGSREAAGGLYKAAANLGVRARVWKAGVDSAGDSGRAGGRGGRINYVTTENQTETTKVTPRGTSLVGRR